MTRFLFLLLLVVSMVGCQSMLSEPGKTVLAGSKTKKMTPESFWAKAVELLHPSEDEFDEEADDETTVKPGYMPVSYQPKTGNSKEVSSLTPPPARKTSSNSLYRPGSIFASPDLLDDTETASSPTDTVQTAEVSVTKPAEERKKSVLQAQNGDSGRFRRLLEQIEETPRDERGVSDSELARLLENFRKTMQEEEAAGLEANYLVILRNKILPNYKPSKKAPPPIDEEEEEDETFEVRDERPRRTERTPKARRPRLEYQEEEDESDLYERKAVTLKNRKKSQNSASIPPETTTQSEPAPTPPLPAPPVYPGLTQLDGTTPAPAPAALPLPQYGNPHPSIVPVHYVSSSVSSSVGSGVGSGTTAVAGETWEHHSRLAAQLLRRQLDTTLAARTFSNEARLRLLELVNGNRNEAVKPFTQVEKPFNDFWGNQILGFSALVDDLGHPDTRSRYTNAAFRFDEGLMDLRRLCPIRLKNVRFARDVWAFGDYLPRSPECHAGEKVDVYLELENPTVRRTGEGFNVSVSISYEIRDNSGSVLEKFSNNSIQSTSPSQRRDYYVHLKVAVPKELTPGSYHLRVSVTDLNEESMLFAEEQIPLTVLPPEREKRAGHHGHVDPVAGRPGGHRAGNEP